MPDKHNEPNRRMYFSDFDPAAKTRPPEPDPHSFATPLTSITQLASTLELDFEDDAEGEDILHAFPQKEPDAEKTAAPAAAAFATREDDPEISLSSDTVAGIKPPADAPTWDSVADAYAKSGAVPLAPEIPILEAVAAETDGVDDVEADVLSMLSAAEDGGGDLASFDFSGFSGFSDFSDSADSFDSPDLSAAATQAFAPEELEAMVAERLAGESDAASAPDRPTQRLQRDTTTSQTDLFSTMDIEELWREKLDSRHFDPAAPGPDTRTVDLFDELDLDALWQDRAPVSARPGDTRYHALPDASETVILAPGVLDGNDTVVMPDGGRGGDTGKTRRLFPGGRSERADRPERSEGAKRADRATGRAADDSVPPGMDGGDAADFLAELDGILTEGDGGAAGKPVAAGGGGDADTEMLDSVAVRARVANAVGEEELRELIDSPGAGGTVGGKGADGLYDPLAGFAEVTWEEVEESEGGGDYIPGSPASSVSSDSFVSSDSSVSSDLDEMDDSVASSGAGAKSDVVTTDDLINDISLGDGVNSAVSAPVIDDSAIERVRGPRPGTEEMQAIMGDYDGGVESGAVAGVAGEGEEAEADAEPVAVDPMDVFANMDDMDFSDDMDDEMRAMLDEDAEGEEAEPASIDIDGFRGDRVAEGPPAGFWGRIKYTLGLLARRYLPMAFIERVQAMIAWRENWWFYCDLLAAIIASASLAVIISYYVWYKE